MDINYKGNQYKKTQIITEFMDNEFFMKLKDLYFYPTA
jgi:hypothetical protein